MSLQRPLLTTLSIESADKDELGITSRASKVGLELKGNGVVLPHREVIKETGITNKPKGSCLKRRIGRELLGKIN